MGARPAWLLIIALAACSDGDDPNSCRPDGVAEGEAMLRGETLGPFARAAQLALPAGTAAPYALVFDETAGACGELASTGKHLSLLFCDVPAPATYRLVTRQVFRCPGPDVLALVEKDGPTDFAEATTGTVTITDAAGCVRGSYTATFGVETIEGVFDAVVCD